MVSNKLIYTGDFKITVIIPIYGVEKYIERCTRSLMEQTMTNGVEYIFVDDATQDNSIAILKNVLKDYSDTNIRIRIISHEINKGLPSARNTGLKYARGEYVMHVDGDDYLEINALELLYHAAKMHNADVVWCDYFITFENKRKLITQPLYNTSQDAVRGMLRGTMKYNVWNKFCRRSIYWDNNIVFPEGKSMGEDLTMIMVLLHARNCFYVNMPLYNYVQNPGQMTAFYNEEKLESLQYNCNRILKYIDQYFAHVDYSCEYSAFKQLIKWPFLLDGKFSSYKRWHKWFPESNALIWQTVGVNNRIRFIEWCAAIHFWPLVWLHYVLIIKFYYGLVYR